MSFLIQSLLAENREQEFREKYSKYCFLGADHEGVTERYSIESDSGELNFGLGVAIAITAVKPKALLAEKHQVIFVGFDAFIAAVPVAQAASIIAYQLLRLDGVFVDMALLRGENICVIHELGALVVTTDLTKVWSVSTELISGWALDDERKTISLTEADSGAVICLSTTTGVVLRCNGFSDAN